MKLQTDSDRAAAPSGPMPTLFEAIVRKRCVIATYNRVEVMLAPHILYTKHGAPYIDAITVFRDSQVPREDKMGAFKVDGLSHLTIADREFGMSTLFDAQSDKYAGVTLLTIEG